MAKKTALTDPANVEMKVAETPTWDEQQARAILSATKIPYILTPDDYVE